MSPIYENVHEIANVSSPLLVVQGTDDEVVPIAQRSRGVFCVSGEATKVCGGPREPPLSEVGRVMAEEARLGRITSGKPTDR